MKVAVLFSGGKDSHLALYKASKEHNVACAITLHSKNKYSYMFQSLGIKYTSLQLELQNIQQLSIETQGEKEKELEDLKYGIIQAIKLYNITGIVTGAILSTYQSSRIQQICDELNIWCFNPLWQMSSESMFEELEKEGFEVALLGVFAYPLNSSFVGKKLNSTLKSQLLEYEKKYHISAIGEGGEYESFVLNGPLYTKSLNLEVKSVTTETENCAYVKEFNIYK